MEERIVSPIPLQGEKEIENSLRPKNFAEYIGQEGVVKNLKVFIQAARERGEPLDHLLLCGPPGLGKTTLAHIVAQEMGVNLRSTSGPALERAGDLAAILTNLQPGDILFVDEIHRLPRMVEEILYPAMEDFALDIVIGKGPSARTLKLDIPGFTLVGATTREGLLTAPLRSRFGILSRLDYYKPEEIENVIARSSRVLDIEAQPEGIKRIASRSRGTPRVANRLLKRVRDVAQVEGNGIITPEIAEKALDQLEVDHLGLEGLDRKILRTIVKKFDGGPVGLGTIAAAISEETETVEDVYEPFLLQAGLLQRTPRGRVATPQAYRHLGLKVPQEGKRGLFDE